MPSTMRLFTTRHPKIEQFLRLWHENGRAQFQRSMPSHNYDTEQRKVARGRRQYVLLNSGNHGVFLVQRSTQYVYQVDDHGRRGKFLNTLDALIEQYTMANERQEQTEAAQRAEPLSSSL
jgi:VCBS repeat-containing protein